MRGEKYFWINVWLWHSKLDFGGLPESSSVMGNTGFTVWNQSKTATHAVVKVLKKLSQQTKNLTYSQMHFVRI